MSSWQNKTVKSWEDEKLLSVPGGVLIKTTLVKSLARHCCTPKPCSYQNEYGMTTMDGQSSCTLHFHAYFWEGVSILQAFETTNAEVRRPPTWWVLFFENVFPFQQWI